MAFANELFYESGTDSLIKTFISRRGRMIDFAIILLLQIRQIYKTKIRCSMFLKIILTPI